MTSSQPVRRFDWNNLGIRAASAVVLIPAAVAAVFFGGWVLLLLVSVAVALLALEWGGMSAPGAPIRIAAAVMVAVLAALFVAYYGHYRIAWAIAGVGAVVAAIVGRSLSERAGDAAYGVVYIAPAVLALFWIRAMPNGISWTIMVFAVAWAADIFAFAVGSAVKGPKLWPRFSPNKTWSGFFGGLAGAMVAALLVSRFTDAKLTLLSAALGHLTFEEPDPERFPAIGLARDALRRGGFAPAAMNAANEVAVAAFLDRRIGFLDIAGAVAETLDRMNGYGDLPGGASGDALETAIMTDGSARRVAAEVLEGFRRLSTVGN